MPTRYASVLGFLVSNPLRRVRSHMVLTQVLVWSGAPTP